MLFKRKITANKARRITAKAQIQEKKRRIKFENQEYKQYLIAIEKVAKQGYDHLTIRSLEQWMKEKMEELGFTVTEIERGLLGYKISW